MARRIPAREVLRLRSSNLSLNAIAAALHASKASVSDVLRAAAEHDVAWEEAERMSAGEVYARLFPEREQPGPVYPDPDWDAVHAELAKAGVTLRLLHGEYREECAARGEAATSYDRFCKRYRQFTVSRNVVSRVGRKAGGNMEVDWSGPTMSLVDPATGVVSQVYLFVACLPFSRYSYVEPALDMKQDTWLRCHVHAFEFLGGATPCIVPDNLKTGVTAHPREGEVVLNAAYEDLAAHYGSAVMPARVRRPRDKASAENEVWCAATYVIGALRNEVFLAGMSGWRRTRSCPPGRATATPPRSPTCPTAPRTAIGTRRGYAGGRTGPDRAAGRSWTAHSHPTPTTSRRSTRASPC